MLYRILFVLAVLLGVSCPACLTVTTSAAYAEEESCDDADGDRECDVTPDNPE